MKIGLDIDGTLAKYFENFIKYYNERFGTVFSTEDIFTLHLWEIFGMQKGEEMPRIEDFSKTDYFRQISPYDGSQEAIATLAEKHNFGIITARSKFLETETRLWLQNHYGDIFQNGNIHFTSQHFPGNGEKQKKSEFCLEHNYDIMVEDYHGHVNECAEKGIQTLLITQPWNKKENLHSSVQRVENWGEILQYLK
ncbi:MAG: hypothetical protein AABY03_01550 [Nanoarchaeota archaeon]